MQVVLLCPVEGVTTSIIDSFVPTARAIVSKRAQAEDLKKYLQPPVYNNGWLLIVNFIPNKQLLTALSKQPENNVVLYKTFNQKACNTIRNLLTENEINFKFVDQANLPEDVVLKWIRSSLNIDAPTTQYLFDRYKGYLPKIDVAIQTLNIFDKVTKSIIQKYTSVSSEVPLYKLTNHLLGLETDYYSAVKVIMQYRYAVDYLIEHLRKKTELHWSIFQHIASGELSIRNYKTFMANSNDKEIKKLKDYNLLVIIESFSHVSVDYLFLVRNRLQSMPKTQGSLYQLINLCKLGGEINE